ncbi:hypothetical protein BC827DRAFT_1159888 [Russula dissimulans]|nr:hypothetical protein BC827DRAFT_1159888 [Russula dissimulans]
MHAMTAFLAISPAEEIRRTVERQLLNYTYIFPGANVNGPVLHMRLYRNDRIIRVIRELYFIGGMKSFATRYVHLFPTSEDRDGVVKHEVPIAMVALVATALYVALLEWRNGQHQQVVLTVTTETMGVQPLELDLDSLEE